MLSSIRKFSTSIYAKILLGIVVIPFIFWGMGSTFTSGNKNVVVVIDKEKYSTQEFINFVQSQQNQNERINSDQIEYLLSAFIGNKLIENEYEYFNIKFSDKSLSKLIKIQEEFIKDNKFSRKTERFCGACLRLQENQSSSQGYVCFSARDENRSWIFHL